MNARDRSLERVIEYRDMLIRAATTIGIFPELRRGEIVTFLHCCQRLQHRRDVHLLIEAILNEATPDISQPCGIALYSNKMSMLYAGCRLSHQYLEAERYKSNIESKVDEIRARRGEDFVELDLISGLVGWIVFSWAAGVDAQAERDLVDRLDRTKLNSLGEKSRMATEKFARNMGIAHGLPGALLVLAQAAAMTGSATYVESCRRIATIILDSRQRGTVSTYGYTLDETKESRVAWCYGDLSVAMSLLRASRLTGDRNMSQAALSLFDAILSRPRRTYGIVDHSICHGTLGLAHCLSKAARWTGRRDLTEHADHWYKVYLETEGPLTSHFEDLSFLTGATGAALALLTYSAPHIDEWDSLMLLSGKG